MKAYRAVWLIVCAAFAVVGVSVAFYAAPYDLVVLSTECGVAVGIWSLLVARYGERSRSSRVRFVLLAGLTGAAAGGAFVGHAVVWGPGVIVLVTALAGTSPVVLRKTARALRAAWGSSGGVELAGSALACAGLGYVPIPRGDDLSLLTDDQLCEAWRSSTTGVRGGSTNRLEGIVEQRQRYLEEFERRNPEGLKVWLASTDTAGCDPAVYLVERWVDLPAADWDELTRGHGS